MNYWKKLDQHGKTMFIVRSAVIAALYAALTLALYPISFGAVQFRVSEALCVLALFTPAAIYGLSLGCLLSNLLSSAALPLDFLIGTLATLIAAVWSANSRSDWFAAVPPVVCNALIVGAMLAWETTGVSAAFADLFAYNALTVGFGEAVMCFLLGVPLLRALDKRERPERT